MIKLDGKLSKSYFLYGISGFPDKNWKVTVTDVEDCDIEKFKVPKENILGVGRFNIKKITTGRNPKIISDGPIKIKVNANRMYYPRGSIIEIPKAGRMTGKINFSYNMVRIGRDLIIINEFDMVPGV